MKSIIFSLLVLFCSICFSLNLQATAQLPDILIYQGKERMLFSNPLADYFNEDHPHPNQILKSSCTANWRGYVATWKIENGFLYLVEMVEGTCGRNPESILQKVFPDQKPPIQATWFTGSLRVPQGKELRYEHMGYETIYEEDLLIEIKKGRLVKEEVIKNQLPDLIQKFLF